MDNPFTVTTPEGMSAEDVVQLFVPVFSDFPKIPRPGHVFLHGPRGSGKSMMFRYLQPDCQCLANKKVLKDLPFYSIYVPVKNTYLNLTELRRLEDQHGSTVLNEHFMTMFIADKTFDFLAKQSFLKSDEIVLDNTKKFATEIFLNLLKDCGWTEEDEYSFETTTVQSCFETISDICNRLYKQILTYLKQLSFRVDAVTYSGPLCGYLDFLYPLFCELKKLPFMPDGVIYLLIDDADNLNLTQTKVLNSWVASRTSSNVSIKISTQFQYKTYRTITNHTIDTPHDYAEVNISTIYTASRKDMYRERVGNIINKRLTLAKINATHEEFFPPDEKQEKKIREIEKEILKNWDKEGRGSRPGDDVTRYARPDYMKSLAGTRKSSYNYSYAGFNQLVNISSGIVRHFLEAAALMYGEVQARAGGKPIRYIPPAIQTKVIRSLSDDFFFLEFEKKQEDQDIEETEKDSFKALRNLIEALGGTFRHILLSDRSERRVFSIAFSDSPSEEIQNVLKLGQRLGYFHVSAIGNKEGTGRTQLYVLSRMLAPHYNLDPNSFAGYLFVTSDRIYEALHKPATLLRRIGKDGLAQTFEEPRQLIMFEMGEGE